jgi:hypothetical protein
VHRAVAVGEVKGERPLAGEPHGVWDGELALPAEPIPEALALDVGHGEPQPTAGLAGIVDREDVGLLEAGGEPDLSKEALGAEAKSQLGVEHLEGDRPVVAEIAGQPDSSHAPAAELALERVAVPQAVAQYRHRVGHGARWIG